MNGSVTSKRAALWDCYRMLDIYSRAHEAYSSFPAFHQHVLVERVSINVQFNSALRGLPDSIFQRALSFEASQSTCFHYFWSVRWEQHDALPVVDPRIRLSGKEGG